MNAPAIRGEFAVAIDALAQIEREVRKVADHSHAYIFMQPVVSDGEPVFRCHKCGHEIACPVGHPRLIWNNALCRIEAREIIGGDS